MNACGRPPQEARRVAEYQGKYEEIRGNRRKYEVMKGKYEEKARKCEENTRKYKEMRGKGVEKKHSRRGLVAKNEVRSVNWPR